MTARGGALGRLTAFRSDSGELLFQLLDAIEPAHGEQHHRIQRFGRAHQPKFQRALLGVHALAEARNDNELARASAIWFMAFIAHHPWRRMPGSRVKAGADDFVPLAVPVTGIAKSPSF